MSDINRCTEALLFAIESSEEYQEYKRQEKILSQDPELAIRVKQFQATNFRLQNETNRDELFAVTEQLNRESRELRRNPQANAYLDAELAICKLMQKICRRLTAGIEMEIPEF